ncbi:M14 family metallopeptidase [Gracilimonas sp.]|uniref:M14 family metallopeptidase n=1 Tax=Gracilimonas sp. TaxID=1974203 RepID=UPI002871E79F|nr:M14 family metallopeptidase [Gracilimonas sp.]
MNKIVLFCITALLLASCKNTEEFTGFSYDPPDVTNTTDKEIDPQHRRVVGIDSPRVWISNEFEGARANDIYALNDSLIEVFVAPENAPINNSPWFAFKVWSDTIRTATIRLNYADATHRYIPKLLYRTHPDSLWKQELELDVRYDSANGTGTFDIMLAPDPVIISAQPLHTSSGLMGDLAKRGIIDNGFTDVKEAGKSKKRRPIWELEITEVEDQVEAPVLAIVGRQHPPEVTGYLASLHFLEELTSGSELAKEFRQTFVIKAFPMLNPDGVDLGQWRHNAGGVDLNRDWNNFNQPETQTVRDALFPIKENDNRHMFYGIDFHSTDENLFYPINEEVKTSPDNVTQRWVEQIIESHPEIEFRVEEFDTSSPIAKNWFFHTFGIDAVTYEVNDQIGEDELEEVSRSAAKLLMEILLEDWEQKTLDN